MAKILVAEDDESTRLLLCAVLKRAGFDVVPAADGLQALDALDRERVDLLVTDIMMPGMDGLELTRQLRDARMDVPILMLTAKNQPVDRREGFVVGTDDYVAKPVDAQELVLRVRALLRRARIVADSRIRVGDVVLRYDDLTVERPGQAVSLPAKEFQLLYKLLAYPDHTFTRMQLLEDVWGEGADPDSASLNVHVNRLRTRFKDWPEFQIVTVRGIGYKAVICDDEAR